MEFDEINPYQTPTQPLPIASLEPTYYGLRTRKLRYFELWRIANNALEFLIAVVLKTLRIALSAPYGYAPPSSAIFCDWESLPTQSREQLQPMIAEAKRLGLELVACYQHAVIGSLIATTAVLRSLNHPILLSVVHLRVQNRSFVMERTELSLLTLLQESGVVITTNERRQLGKPPHFEYAVHDRETLAELLQIHLDRLSQKQRLPINWTDDNQIVQTFLACEEEEFDYLRNRGVLVPLSPLEIERFHQLGQRVSETPIPIVDRDPLGWVVVVAVVLAAFTMVMLPRAGMWKLKYGLLALTAFLVGLAWCVRLIRWIRRRS